MEGVPFGPKLAATLLLTCCTLLHAQTTGQWSRGPNSLGQQSPGVGDIQNARQQSPGFQNPAGSQSSVQVSKNGLDEGANTGGALGPSMRVRPGKLICYSCKLDFRKAPYNWENPCLGRHNGLNVSTDYLVKCGPNDVYCRAERTEVNGVLITLTRECTDVCYSGCRPKGFGIGFESCTRCCNNDACNHMYPLSGAGTPILNLSTVFLGWFVLAFTHCPWGK